MGSACRSNFSRTPRSIAKEGDLALSSPSKRPCRPRAMRPVVGSSQWGYCRAKSQLIMITSGRLGNHPAHERHRVCALLHTPRRSRPTSGCIGTSSGELYFGASFERRSVEAGCCSWDADSVAKTKGRLFGLGHRPVFASVVRSTSGRRRRLVRSTSSPSRRLTAAKGSEGLAANGGLPEIDRNVFTQRCAEIWVRSINQSLTISRHDAQLLGRRTCGRANSNVADSSGGDGD
jgi:hypothetical protein